MFKQLIYQKNALAQAFSLELWFERRAAGRASYISRITGRLTRRTVQPAEWESGEMVL